MVEQPLPVFLVGKGTKGRKREENERSCMKFPSLLKRRHRIKPITYSIEPDCDPNPSPLIFLGAAYLCDACRWIGEYTDHGMCKKCGSQTIFPVETFLRRI